MKASIYEINLSGYINSVIHDIVKNNFENEDSWYVGLNPSNVYDHMCSDNGQFSFLKKDIKKIAKFKIQKIDDYIFKHDLSENREAILAYLRKYFWF